MIERAIQWLEGTPETSAKSLLRDVLCAFALCTPLALVFMWSAFRVAGPNVDVSALPSLDSSFHRIGAVLIGPPIESALMVFVFGALRVLQVRPLWMQCVGSAAIWAFAHGVFNLMWGIGTFWPFLVFSAIYLRWEKVTLARGIGAAAAVHALHNLTMVLLAYLAR